MSRFIVSHMAESTLRSKPIPQSLTYFVSSQDLHTNSPYWILKTNYQTSVGYAEARILSANHQTPTSYVMDIVLGTRHQVPTNSFVVWFLRTNHRSPTIHLENKSLLAIYQTSLCQMRWRSLVVAVWQSLAEMPLSLAVHLSPITVRQTSRSNPPSQMGKEFWC